MNCENCNSMIILKLLTRISIFNMVREIYTHVEYSCDCCTRSSGMNPIELAKEYPSIHNTKINIGVSI